MTVELDHAENDFITRFGFLEGEHAYSRIVEVKQGDALAQRAGMLWRLEGYERITQPVGLPVGLHLSPAIGVSGHAEYEFVVTPVLVCLVAIALRTSISRRLHSGRAQKGQPDGIVIRLIGAVLIFGQDGRSEGAALVGEIDPAVGGDSKLPFLRVGP